MIERTAIITDQHGCIEELNELLYLLDYKSPNVYIISGGDAIDRGPDSLGCIRKLRELNIISMLGNHEAKYLKWYHNVGSTNDVYGKHPHYTQFSEDDINYMARMPLYIKLEEHNTVIVHAGLRAGVPLEKQTKDDLCYIRYVDNDSKFVSLRKINKLGSKEAAGAHFWTEYGSFNINVIYGHQVWNEPRIDRFDDGTSCIGIDTGCCFGGALTAYIIETQEFIQVKAKKVYYKSTFEVR